MSKRPKPLEKRLQRISRIQEGAINTLSILALVGASLSIGHHVTNWITSAPHNGVFRGFELIIALIIVALVWKKLSYRWRKAVHEFVFQVRRRTIQHLFRLHFGNPGWERNPQTGISYPRTITLLGEQLTFVKLAYDRYNHEKASILKSVADREKNKLWDMFDILVLIGHVGPLKGNRVFMELAARIDNLQVTCGHPE